MIYTTKPKRFNASMEVVSCFIECKGEILLLLRQPHKPEGNTWCMPAGKINLQETPREAIIRETKEETGILLNNPQHHHTLYVKYPNKDFVYHIYKQELLEKPVVIINPLEHQRYVWVTPTKALDLSLIPDQDLCIKLFYQLP